MSLYPRIVRAGAQITCTHCQHEHIATAEWLAKMRERIFPARSHDVLYEADFWRLKCTSCGAREPRILEPVRAKIPEPESSQSLGGFDIPFFPDWRDQG